MGKRNQVCMWMDEPTNAALLKKQVAMAETLGRVPSKSEILRNALQLYLQLTDVESYHMADTPRSISHRNST